MKNRAEKKIIPSKKFLKTIITVVKPLLKIVYPYEIKGYENIENAGSGYIICANHLSNIDPVFIVATHPEMINFMGKYELFKYKISNWFFRKVGVFPVYRGQKGTNVIDEAKAVLERNEILGIFPEGMRSKSGKFLHAKLGCAKIAVDSNAKIIPVCITGSGKNNLIKAFKKTTVQFGEPIFPEELVIEKETGEIKNLKFASKLIMEKISKMRENKENIC